MEYDAQVIEEFAARLYKRANSIIFQYCFLGVVLGAIVGTAVGASMGGNSGTASLVGAAIVGLLGYSAGREKAFQLKLQAQVALVQVQIERNTKEK